MKRIIFFISFISIFLSVYAQPPGHAKKKQKKEKTHQKHQHKAEQGPPSWAPAHGFRAKTRYVFFKEHKTYYDTREGIYIHYNNGDWKVSAEIPLGLNENDLQSSTYFELDYFGDKPQKKFSAHMELEVE